MPLPGPDDRETAGGPQRQRGQALRRRVVGPCGTNMRTLKCAPCAVHQGRTHRCRRAGCVDGLCGDPGDGARRGAVRHRGGAPTATEAGSIRRFGAVVGIGLEELACEGLEPDGVDRPILILAGWPRGAHDPGHLAVDPVPERAAFGQGPAAFKNCRTVNGSRRR